VLAGVVVVAAGGMGTPGILNRSGLDEAGRGFLGDPLIMSSGCADDYHGPGMYADITMCCGTNDYLDDGILISDLLDPWPSYLLQLAYKGVGQIPRIIRHRRMLGVMCKVADTVGGRVFPDETFSKAMQDQDRKRLDRGARLNEQILQEAGCDPKSIVHTPVRLGHPGGTARIGQLVDTDLETQVKNLFVCDNSITPEPYGLPPVLMLVAAAKRLVDRRLKAIV
jgi:choline dehydrogenase-like flavoprotein